MTFTPDEYEAIEVALHPEDERVCQVHLDAPARSNALDLDMLVELNAALRAADAAGDVHAMLLGSSTDGAFCAGGDVEELAALSVEDGNRFLSTYLDTVDLMWTTGKPVVAAVTGACVGGGNELAMACDLVVAGESARFGQPEIRIGSTAAGGGIQMLPLVVGMQRAKDLLYTARLLSAEEALDWGLVNRVVPDDEVRDRALALVRSILDEASPGGFRTMKAMLGHWYRIAMANRALDRELTARVWRSDEFRERARAFLDKEDPPSRPFTGTAPSER